MTKDEGFKANTRTVFGVSVSLERAALAALLLFTFLLPLGTRYIFLSGEINGSAVEWGTVSVFVTQILAAVFAALALSLRRREVAWVNAWPAVLLGTLVMISALRSSDLVQSFVSNAWWLLMGLAVWLGIRLLRPDSRLVLGVLVASASAQAALAALQFGFQAVWGSKWLGIAPHDALVAGASVVDAADGRWLRAYGTLPHPNILGIYCAVGLTVAFWSVLRGSDRIGCLAALALPILTLGLVFSFSRSAWVGAALGVSVVLAVAVRRGSGRRRKLALAASAAVAATVIGTVITVPAPFLSRVTASGRLEAKSVSERVSAIQDARSLLAVRPLLGVGPGQMTHAVAEAQPDRSGWSYQPVHLLPLIVAVEIGCFGLLAWIVWLAWPCTAAFLRTRKVQWVSGPAAVALIVMIVAGLFDHYAWTLWPGAALLFLLSGLSAVETDCRSPLPKEDDWD